ncbi:type VI secretion system lipoprotein TssJ [Pseudomonas sp. SWRI51]|uniref:type VI secretion system lipoprotein TssJ n=1 Tax=Pseudomonas sp. SWRI51 TaxID=2745491 RepID=UPI0016467C3C|nr:type VI secretion system lipoprotein TssJ [Pseudomonas sp. SWRI51]MBC3409951.1 type VI secretion system lipoprotein TssJ [Pseudomonas sp. SWRI51]
MTRPACAATAMLMAAIGLAACTPVNRMAQVLLDPSLPIGAPPDHPTQIAFSINASPALNAAPDELDVMTGQPSTLEPSPYAVTLSAGDPYALTDKLTTLLTFMHEQFPAMSPVPPDTEGEEDLPRSPLEESTPGRYEDPAVLLTLPRPTTANPVQAAAPIAIKILQLRDDSLLRNSLYQSLDNNPAKALRSTYISHDDYLLRPGQFKFVPFVALHADTRFVAVVGDYRNQQDATWQQVLRIPPRGRQIALSVLLNEGQLLLREED